MSEILYHITGKLYCKTQATAFLINENTAITARHAVIHNINKKINIELEFYDISGKQSAKRVNASIIGESKKYDIAILELQHPVIMLDNWANLSSQKTNLNDTWECVGFPIGWDSVDEGSKFCYIKGDIYQDSGFDQTIKYDLHLSGKYINQGWEESLEGLSGSPVMINGEIKAIVIAEEYSFISSPIKSISINRIVDFLEEHGIKIKTSFGSQNNLINSRLVTQREKCAELFQQVEYQGVDKEINLQISAYHLKYNDDGTPQVKQLSEYLASSITDYACTLADLEKMTKGIIKPLPILKETNKVIEILKNNERFGSILLWMFVEGILGAPKGLKRISIDDEENVFNELHIGLSTEHRLVLYLGEGKLNNYLEGAVSKAIESLNKVIDINEDIFYIDDYIYEQIDSQEIKELLTNFKKHSEVRDNIVLELTVFTGYDSTFLKEIEEKQLPKEHIEAFIARKYINECTENEQYICEAITKNLSIKNIKINWFIVPFNTTKSFEELFFTEIM